MSSVIHREIADLKNSLRVVNDYAMAHHSRDLKVVKTSLETILTSLNRLTGIVLHHDQTLKNIENVSRKSLPPSRSEESDDEPYTHIHGIC